MNFAIAILPVHSAAPATAEPSAARTRRETRSKHSRLWHRASIALCGTGLALGTAATTYAADLDLPQLLPPAFVTSTTVPQNGDENPYGVAFVPEGFPDMGTIAHGDLLISNFNNSNNKQGTGSTIVKIVPNAKQATTFFQGPTNIGLTTALGVLRAGFVIVGNTPTSDGTFSTIQAGSLIVLNRTGQVVAQWTTAAKADGPWDLTIFDQGNTAKVFVSNVLNGTVVRLDTSIDNNGVHINKATQIASGYPHRGDPTALALGPTGVAFDPVRDVLYVASTVDNAIFALYGAGTTQHDGGKGVMIYSDNTHLHGPLGLVLGPNGHLFTANGDAINSDPTQPSEIVEFTPQGQFVAQLSIDPAQGGAFGLAFGQLMNEQVPFAAVDDNTNTVTNWTLPFETPGQ
jgi:hypothetical protein